MTILINQNADILHFNDTHSYNLQEIMKRIYNLTRILEN